MQRPTMADIARVAGVSKGAVSYALNGRPGVSPETRDRIRVIADELGWVPNSAARALSAARAGALGLVLARPARTLGIESFFMQFISGVESELSARQVALVVQVVEDHEAEIATYKRWWAERRIDGVIVMDVWTDDARLPALADLGLPAVLTGGGPGDRGGMVRVWSDNAAPVERTLEHLRGLGHRRVARVAGLAELEHTVIRGVAFDAWSAGHGVDAVTVYTDYTPDEGARATREILKMPSRPTAVVYDNDVMAIAGLGVCQEAGVDVPGALSIVAWDDSPLCQMVHPPLTALSRDVPAYGALVARCLLDVVDGVEVGLAEQQMPALIVRGSTARPSRRTASSPQ